jgi:hypothetical protein
MIIALIKLIYTIYLMMLQLKNTNSYLTNHEAEELYIEIKKLHIKIEECNNNYNSLLLDIIHNKSKIDISKYLTTSPYFYD